MLLVTQLVVNWHESRRMGMGIEGEAVALGRAEIELVADVAAKSGDGPVPRRPCARGWTGDPSIPALRWQASLEAKVVVRRTMATSNAAGGKPSLAA